MNKPTPFVSFARARARRFVLASLLALLLFPQVGAAAELAVRSAAVSEPPATHSGWSINATPVLILPEDGHGWGGGADPELKYTHDLGAVRVSAGGRVGAYYAKSQFGVAVMPTLRVMVPVGALEPYLSGGLGYGWVNKTGHGDLMSMARAGFVYRFSKSFAVGLEGTTQQLAHSDYRFFSVGSMMAFEL